MPDNKELDKINSTLKKLGFSYYDEVGTDVPSGFGMTRVYQNIIKGLTYDPVLVVHGIGADSLKITKFFFSNSDVDEQFDYHVSSIGDVHKGTDEYVSEDSRYVMKVPTTASGHPDSGRKWEEHDFFYTKIIDTESGSSESISELVSRKLIRKLLFGK